MFERLTHKNKYGRWVVDFYGLDGRVIKEFHGAEIDRLAAYEDTGLTPEQIQVLLAEKETTLNGTYISMEAHNREVKKLKAEIGYEQDRIDCRNTICNANREGMYRKCAELESQIEALTTDKDELVKVLKQAREAIKAAWSDGSANAAMDKASEALTAIDKVIGGKEDGK